jgi:hypothetical protein
MLKKLVVAIALAGALVISGAARAHEGHPHKVMGTVSSIDGKNVTLKTTDGKTVTVVLGAKTKIIQGKKTVEATALKVGDRLVAEGTDDKAMFLGHNREAGRSSRPDGQEVTTARRVRLII